MLSLTSDQIASLSGETTTLARLLQITNSLGNVFYYTDCDIDLIVGSNTYKSNIGFDVSAIVMNVGTNLSTCSCDLLLDDSAINKAMIEAGLLDGAEAIVSIVDWLFPSRGAIERFRGNIQTIEYKDQFIATFDIEPLLSRSLPLNIDLVSSNCRADLGDAKCGINIDALKKTFTIATVHNLQAFDTDLTDADDTWNIGLVLFTSGANNGIALEIGQYVHTNGEIILQLLAPYPIEIGDTGTVYPGCDKTAPTCASVYNNIVNFRGEPFGLNTTATAAAGTPVVGNTSAPTPSSAYTLLTFAAGSAPTDGASYHLFYDGPSVIGQNFAMVGTPGIIDNNVWIYHKTSATTGYLSTATDNLAFSSGINGINYFSPTNETFFVLPVGALSNLAYGSPTPDRDGEAANTSGSIPITLAAAIALGKQATDMSAFNITQTAV